MVTTRGKLYFSHSQIQLVSGSYIERMRLALVVSFVPNNCLRWMCMFHDENKSQDIWICTIKRFCSDMYQMSNTITHTITLTSQFEQSECQRSHKYIFHANMQLQWPSTVCKCFLPSVCVWDFLGSDCFSMDLKCRFAATIYVFLGSWQVLDSTSLASIAIIWMYATITIHRFWLRDRTQLAPNCKAQQKVQARVENTLVCVSDANRRYFVTCLLIEGVHVRLERAELIF